MKPTQPLESAEKKDPKCNWYFIFVGLHVVHIDQAAQYDPFGPGMSHLGTAIRDAACFVCWAIARTYNEETLQPHVLKLTEALITVS